MTPDTEAAAATPVAPIWGRVDRAFAVVIRCVELALGLAFLFAVVLNFVTAADRFLFKKSIIGSDEVQVFIAPLLVGGAGAVAPMAGQGAVTIAEGLRLADWSWESSDGNLCLHGRVNSA